MSRPWPYNPQPTFPPLPRSPAGAGPSSPSSVGLREALRSIAAEVERGERGRPETTPDPRLEMRRRKVEASRAEIMETLTSKCEKCQDLEAEHAEASGKFFKEIEHLRRALGKMLDAASEYMPAMTLRTLTESLQLDVRYLTRPEKGEGGPLPPVPVQEVVDYSKLIEELKKQIADHENVITLKTYTIQDLEEELRKLQEQLKAAGLVVSPTRQRPKRTPPESREIQTDPWQPFAPKQETVQVVETAKVDPTPVVAKVKKEKKPQAVEEPESDSSDAPVVQEGKKVQKVQKEKEAPQIIKTGIDPEVVRKLQAEIDLLRVKLATAERELAKMDGLKAEIERLKQQVSDRDKKIEELEEEIKRLKALPKPKQEVKQEIKQTTKPVETKEKKKEKKFKQDPAPVPKTQTQEVKPTTEKEDVPPPVVEEEKPQEPEEVISESSSEELEESLPPKTFEDKCVGNGPGAWSLLDEPLILKGKAILKEDLNKTGKCYERYMVEQPTLGLAGTPGVSTCTDDIDPATLARLKGNRGVSVYGGNALLGGVQFTSWNSKSMPRLGSTWPSEAEPYLTQVWEQHPKGHKAPVKRELIKLGAISPQKASSLQSVGSLDSTTMKTLGAFSLSQGTMKIPDGWADATLLNNTNGLNVVGDTIKAEVMNEMNATS